MLNIYIVICSNYSYFLLERTRVYSDRFLGSFFTAFSIKSHTWWSAQFDNLPAKLRPTATQKAVFATTFFHLVAGKKRLRMFLTLSPVHPCIVNTARSKCMFVEIVILWLTGYEVDFLKVLRTFAISGLEASFHFGEFSRATKWWAIWACAARNPSWKRAFTGERAVSSGIWIKFNFFTTRMSESQSDCFFSIVRWIFFKFWRDCFEH